MTHQSAGPASASRFCYACIVVVLLAGAWLRLHDIARESVWWDEFSSLIHLAPPQGYADSPHIGQWQQTVINDPAPTLPAFLAANRTLDPATMPLYYTLEYFAWQAGGGSILLLRLISFVLSMAALPLMYRFASSLFGPRAGLLAMSLLALSPVHAQFAQEIRMYALFTLLALVSAHAFAQVLRGGGRRWWAVNGVANMLLLWTHPFAAWVLLVEGLALLPVQRDHWRRFLAWGFLNLLLAAPAAAYILSIRFFDSAYTDSWMLLPTVSGFIGDLIGDDFIGMTTVFWGSPEGLARVLPDALAGWLANQAASIGALLSLLVLVLAAMALRRSPSDAGPEVESRRVKAFLVLWVLLPPVILLALSYGWRPMIQPRYTLQCSLALYALVSAGAFALPLRWMRTAAVAVLLAGYGYQQALLIPQVYHPDWRGAADLVREESGPDDLILAHDWLFKRVFAYNLGPVPNVVSYGGASNQQDYGRLADIAARWTAQRQDADGPGLWVVIRNGYFSAGPLEVFEQALAARGLSWTFHEFGGIQHVCVYRVLGTAAGSDLLQEALDPETADQLVDLAKAYMATGDYATALALAGGSGPAPRDNDPESEPEPASPLDRAFADALAGVALAAGAEPEPTAETCLGLLLDPLLRTALHDDAEGRGVPWDAIDAAYREHAPVLHAAVLAPLGRRLDSGQPLDDFIRSLRALYTGGDAIAAGDVEEALYHVEAAVEDAPDHGRAVLLQGLMRAHVQGDIPAAGVAVGKVLESDPGLGGLLRRLAAALEQNDRAAAMRVIDPLAHAGVELGNILQGVFGRLLPAPH
ncbi:MAG: hypothetical protein GC168_16415 [Candidatus Hydrogenedens sp.]|nr:hypothetical protein [Candidatus Hydrogenedens sp.]